jgi:hypothetical protein
MAVPGAQSGSSQPNPQQVESPQALKAWWAGFKKRTRKQEQNGMTL